MKISVINEQDGNDVFEAEGDTMEECLAHALAQLGWSAYESTDDDDDDDDEQFNEY